MKKKKVIKQSKVYPKGGIMFIASALNKRFKRRFPTVASAKEDARHFIAQQKKAGAKVTLTSLYDNYRKRKIKPNLLGIPESLSEPDNFFSLVDYPERILGVANNIYFKSALSPSTLPRIQGGKLITYEEYFSDFVSYCNDLKKYAIDEKQYDEDWYVRCVPDTDKNDDKINKANGKLFFRIISCDADGNPFDYGFNPRRPETKPTETMTTPTPVPVATTPATNVTNAKGDFKDNDLEIQKLRAKTAEEERKAQELKVLLRLYDDKLISGKEFKEQYDKLK